MKRLFLDVSQNDNCIGVFINKETEVLQAGTTIYSMPVKDKNEEYQKFADCRDIHFIFDDNIVNVDFYSVPRVDILATDSQGGYIGTIGGTTDMESDMPICYIDKDRNVFWLADNFKEFLNNCSGWKEKREPYDKVEVFASKEEAEGKYEFVSIC